MPADFCSTVAKVLVPFQHINTLQLSGPIHSALICSPGHLSMKKKNKNLAQWIPQWKPGQNGKLSTNQNLVLAVLSFINHPKKKKQKKVDSLWFRVCSVHVFMLIGINAFVF